MNKSKKACPDCAAHYIILLHRTILSDYQKNNVLFDHTMESTMNLMRTGAELTRQLFNINANTLRGLADMERTNLDKYLELNSDYVGRLSTIEGVQGLVGLQREYNSALWNGMRESWMSRGELMRNAMADAGKVLRETMTAGRVAGAEEEANPADAP